MSGKKGLIGFSFAWNGLKEVLKTERNFRFHLLASLFVIIASFYFNLTYVEWAIIILVIGLVLVAEIINSSIEKIIDYLNPAIHPAAKVIKDTAAGAVLVAAMIAVIVGMIIFLPKLIILVK